MESLSVEPVATSAHVQCEARAAVSPMDRVRLATHLRHSDILDAFRGDAIAIQIPGFVSASVADTIASALAERRPFAGYKAEPGFQHAAPALYDVAADPVEFSRFQALAGETAFELASFAYPLAMPHTIAREQLDCAWPHGVERLRLESGRLPWGIDRMVTTGGQAYPHTDVIAEDVPSSAVAKQIKHQLSVLIYLEMPHVGGELELWDVRPTLTEHAAIRRDGNYGFERSKIGEPIVTLRPVPGDLIAFDATQIHAVRPVCGRRITLSFFAGFVGTDHPLLIWS